MNQPTRLRFALSLVVALCCVRQAQAQITVSATAPNPLSVSASSTIGAQSDTLPAGPLGSAVWLSAFQFPAIASFTQVVAVNHAEARLDWTLHAQLDGSLGPAVGSASCGPNVVDLQLSTAQPTQVLLEVVFVNLSTPGAPTPGFTIDIGNDGIVENTNGQWSSLAQAFLSLDSQPVTIRVTASTDVAAQGTARAVAALRVTPRHTDVSPPLVLGCGGIALNVLPTFTATGIDVFTGNPGWPTAVVFGFAPQPILLPSTIGQPCLLYPQLDVVLPAPPTGPLSIPLPATVRPFQVWVQAVGIAPLGLGISSAHRLNGW